MKNFIIPRLQHNKTKFEPAKSLSSFLILKKAFEPRFSYWFFAFKCNTLWLFFSENLKYILNNKYSIKIKTEKKPYDNSITFLFGKIWIYIVRWKCKIDSLSNMMRCTTKLAVKLHLIKIKIVTFLVSNMILILFM